MTVASPVRLAPPALVWAALAAVYVIWGSTYLAIRVMVETIPPFLGAGVRYVVAGGLMWAFLRARGGPGAVRVGRRELAGLALVGTLLVVGGNGLVVFAEQDVPSGLAALIIAAVPLWLVIFRSLAGDHPARLTVTGVLVGFAGVAVLVAPGGRPEDAPTLGVAIVVVASFSWALGSFASGRVPMPRSPWSATAIEMLCGGVLLLLIGVAAGELGDLDLAAISARSAFGLVYLTTFGSLVAFTAYVWLLQNAPLSLVGTYAFVNPVVAVFLGALLLSEEITSSVLLGGAVIVVGVALVILREGRRRRETPDGP